MIQIGEALFFAEHCFELGLGTRLASLFEPNLQRSSKEELKKFLESRVGSGGFGMFTGRVRVSKVVPVQDSSLLFNSTSSSIIILLLIISTVCTTNDSSTILISTLLSVTFLISFLLFTFDSFLFMNFINCRWFRFNTTCNP